MSVFKQHVELQVLVRSPGGYDPDYRRKVLEAIRAAPDSAFQLYSYTGWCDDDPNCPRLPSESAADQET